MNKETKVLKEATTTNKGNEKAKVTERKPCVCGCGKIPAGRRSKFMPGHDMKLKSSFLAAAKSGDDTAKAELKRRGW